jgi:hypothetical protein
MTRPITVSTTAVVAGLVASSLALSACQKPAASTAAVSDPNAAPAAPAPAPYATSAPPPTVRYIERPSRREHEDEQAYAARLASDAAYHARLQQAAADQARYGQQQADRDHFGPPPPPPGDPYRAGLRNGQAQGFDQGRDQQARLDAYQSQAARQGEGQARVDEARHELADAYRQAAETPDPSRRAQMIAAAKDRLAAAMAAAGR